MAYQEDFYISFSKKLGEMDIVFKVTDNEGYNTLGERRLNEQEAVDVMRAIDDALATQLADFVTGRIERTRNDKLKRLTSLELDVARLRDELNLPHEDLPDAD